MLRDSTSRQPLIGASVPVPGTAVGGTTDVGGRVQLVPTPAVGTQLRLAALDYRPRTVQAPVGGSPPLVVLLAPGAAIAEVVVTTTRSNSRIEEQPERIESLGRRRDARESRHQVRQHRQFAGRHRGHPDSVHLARYWQRRPAPSGPAGAMRAAFARRAAALRQFCGQLRLLAVPPLDLQQVERRKGFNPTHYGGGAIAGLVNLVSKTPMLGTPQYRTTLNQTTLRETNLNGFAAALGLLIFWRPLVLNGENLLDYRQTRRERVRLPPLGNRVFRELWAPVEGRVCNLSLNWRFGTTGF